MTRAGNLGAPGARGALGVFGVFGVFGWMVVLAAACSSGAIGGTGTAGAPATGAAGNATGTGAAGHATGAAGNATGAAGSGPFTAGTAGSPAGATGAAGAAGASLTGAAGVGMSTGAAGTGGISNPERKPCGMKAGQCECEPTLSERKAPAFPPTQIPAPKGLLFRFMNNCPMTLWLQFAGAPGGSLMMPTKTTQEIDLPTLHGRVTEFKNAAPGAAGSVEAEFFELTADPGKALNYNVSYVDYLGLPIEINGKGSSPTCAPTACYVPFASMLEGCPPQLLDTKNGKCLAPRFYCGAPTSAHGMEAFCTVLDQSAADTLKNDPKCQAGGTLAQAGSGSAIFGCGTGTFWGSSNYCCAKVNRGSAGPTPNDATQNCSYYKTPPYNVYAAYSHSICPYIYAFPYDDWNDQSGFHTCTGGTGAEVTFCPGDP